MPISNLIKAGKKMLDSGGNTVSPGRDPEIPVPGRKREVPTVGPMSNKEALNRAADVLKVPGREVVRGAVANRKKMLDEF